MSEPHVADDLATDPVMSLLADVAKWDVQLAREAHDRAMAADGNDEFNQQCRTYQRMARSLRQTLAIRERILRERRLAAAQRAALKPARFDHVAVGERLRVLRDAVGRLAWNEYEPEAVTEKMRDIDMALSEMSLEDADFATRPLADQLVALCERFEIPTRGVGLWRDLPRAAISAIPAFVTEAAQEGQRKPAGKTPDRHRPRDRACEG
ncbi:MAG: hypothetical protein DI570_06505 [Phenylobacterium zucineum]|nr:MAG: hypothetical protein DI570_06505 [Phenylobacterium zucineum]